MIIYDKALWHIDGGENEKDVIARFKVLYDFFNSNNMLSKEGIEIFNLGIDNSVSIHEGLLNDKGNQFAKANINNLIALDLEQLKQELDNLNINE